MTRWLARATRAWLRFRVRLRRAEWSWRLLRLPSRGDDAGAPGLLLIQIDGLGRDQFDAALRAGRLPFLARLLARERYRLHDLYAGVPSTTPAVQAELFYGQPASVPAFSFRHPVHGTLVRMFEPGTARETEEALAALHEPLLRDGAAYGNIFTGGASEQEAHFCVSALGLGPLLRSARPFALIALVLGNFASVLRVLTLLVVEFGLALYDFARGAGRRGQLWHELRFVPARVAICVGLRELITIGAGMDLARGLPIVHVNFAGFDEQSHRRGPNAAFAHWALKGIDAAIARLWRQAMRAERRDYRVWIYSDHGQERVKSYPLVHGQALQAVVEAALETAPSGPRAAPRAEASYRARTLRQAGLPYPQLPPEALADGRPSAAHVAAMGPVGFVYLPTAPDFDTRRRLAERLVAAQVPVVLASMELDRVHAWTADGELLLPQDGERLLGASHPFGAHALADLIDLVRHPGAGDLTVAGWCAGRQPLSFAVENGAHGGFGPRETRGIAITDSSARLPRDAARPLRARDIRQAALTLLGRGDPAACATRPSGDVHAASLRVMTYNTHACLGLDGRALPHRIARVIAECQADIVCLQELDVGRARSDGIDQAERVAAHLTMQHVFHAAVELREERYGNAVLSPLPMRLVQSARLPGIGAREPRGVLWVAIDLGGVELQVINTHLGLRAAERQVQVEFLTSEDWLGAAMQRGPVVMCGDFNAGERSYVWRTLRSRLTDVQVENASHTPRNTWFARHPTRRLDHIFVSRDFRVVGVDVPRTQLTRVASDHLPVVAELALGVEAVSKASAGAG